MCYYGIMERNCKERMITAISKKYVIEKSNLISEEYYT